MSVGLPSGPVPPTTKILPPEKPTAALARGSGSFGPSAHLSKLPTPDVFATKVVSVAAVPSLPPMYRILVPNWAIAPSIRGAGQRRAPAGRPPTG